MAILTAIPFFPHLALFLKWLVHYSLLQRKKYSRQRQEILKQINRIYSAIDFSETSMHFPFRFVSIP